MSKLYLFLFVVGIVSMSSCVQYQDVVFKDNEGVVQIYDSLSSNQSELFVKANGWMVETFNDASSVIQYSDKEAGVLIGKYLLSGKVLTGLYGATADTRVYAKIELKVKDNKARIIITPMSSWRYDSSGMTIYNYSKEDAIDDMNKLAESFKSYISQSSDDF